MSRGSFGGISGSFYVQSVIMEAAISTLAGDDAEADYQCKEEYYKLQD